MLCLAALSSQAFTAPMTHLAMPSRASAISMLAGPEDSVPMLIGLGQRDWPSETDTAATLGGFVVTNADAANDVEMLPEAAPPTTPEVKGVVAPTKAPTWSGSPDAVPAVIGLAWGGAWPSEYDKSTTMGSTYDLTL